MKLTQRKSTVYCGGMERSKGFIRRDSEFHYISIAMIIPFCLFQIFAIAQGIEDGPRANLPAPPVPVPGEQAGQQQNTDPFLGKRLAQQPECHADVQKHCRRELGQLAPNEILSDMLTLKCLQDAGLSETETLTPDCANAIWDFKVELTKDERFLNAISRFCLEEMQKNPTIRGCTLETRPGYALSCMMDHALQTKMDRSSRCYRFLEETAEIAFSDFQLIAPFVDKCGTYILQLNCGTLTKPSLHQRARVPHSQGSTLECLIDKLVNVPKDPQKAEIASKISQECRQEVMRIAELQSDDFHLDRPLYFACRKDREQFCGQVQAGEGKVFECLMKHKEDTGMDAECSRMLSERAGLMGQDYRLAHPLLKACEKEMPAYRCVPQQGFQKSLQFHLSWVLLCLENGFHWWRQQLIEREKALKDPKGPQPPPIPPQPFTESCQKEMISHRQMMVQEFRMSPELVMSCAQEIDKLCSPSGDLESEGKTIHCLMKHAQERDAKKALGTDCQNALHDLIKVADIGANYKVDKVLYASCSELINGKCSKDLQSEASTLACLMDNLDESEMTDDCENRLIEVQYFMARDWTLDPQLYEACHTEAVSRCSANKNWNENSPPIGASQAAATVNPGPQVLACLYRNAYDEQQPLSSECAHHVHRVLRERAIRVNLIPEVENSCRNALSEYCSQKINPSEEMHCLQEYFEQDEFKQRYETCQKAVAQFTQMESKDTKLNRLLTRACRPVIETYCQEFNELEIDHGDVLNCLSQHKEAEEMLPKCRSYVNHFELISLRDYHFSYRFTDACKVDIDRHCSDVKQDKAAIIRCLSNIVFEHKVLGEHRGLNKECRQQLRVAYLQQEQVNFDDKEHMKDVDPDLMANCDADIKKHRCMSESNERFEDVVECLRVNFDELAPKCKASVFGREKIEAVDNTFDDELMRSCKFDIGKFCDNQKGEQRVLDCLSNTKIVRLLQKGCQRIVQERLAERARDDRLNPGFIEACKSNAQQHCPDEYNQVKNSINAKQQLGPVIANCLRQKYAQHNGALRLDPQCQDELFKLILEAEFDAKLDPPLYKACKASIAAGCQHDVIARSGEFYSILDCLKDGLQKGRITDRECAEQVARRTKESLVDIHLDPALHEACSIDVQRICHDTPPGQGRIVMCLMDGLRKTPDLISNECRRKLGERDRLWNMAHDKYKMALPENWSEAMRLIAEHPARNSILMWMGVGLIALLAIGCCCGRLTKRTHRELKNR